MSCSPSGAYIYVSARIVHEVTINTNLGIFFLVVVDGRMGIPFSNRKEKHPAHSYMCVYNIISICIVNWQIECLYCAIESGYCSGNDK